MRRCLSLAAAAALVGAMTVACSGTAGPSGGTAGERQRGIAVTPPARPAGEPTLTVQQSGTTNRLQAVSPVNQQVVWASGLAGTFVVTTDGGETWRAGQVPGAETLEFRDVEGVSAKEAYLLSAGTGSASRIYKTADGGQTWTLQFQNTRAEAFYDCFDFWSPNRGLTFSDPVNNRFPVIRTTKGESWEDIGDLVPRALDGEFAFAASGTCVATQGDRRAWIVTGGATTARVLATLDGGNSWSAYPTPLVSNPSAGGFTVAFRDPFNGIVAGGDLDPKNPSPNNRVAVSGDGGQTWQLVKAPPFEGAVFGLSYVTGIRQTLVATGPGGAAWSGDEGRSWNLLGGVTGFWAVAFASHKAGWLVGTEGRILKVRF
jgi:photosystem II stability/assembly factor-like uncharacterized protein